MNTFHHWLNVHVLSSNTELLCFTRTSSLVFFKRSWGQSTESICTFEEWCVCAQWVRAPATARRVRWPRRPRRSPPTATRATAAVAAGSASRAAATSRSSRWRRRCAAARCPRGRTTAATASRSRRGAPLRPSPPLRVCPPTCYEFSYIPNI